MKHLATPNQPVSFDSVLSVGLRYVSSGHVQDTGIKVSPLVDCKQPTLADFGLELELLEPLGDRKTLTPKQQQIFNFIAAEIRVKGFSPTHQEIANRFGFASKNAVFRHVHNLVLKGWIIRKPGEYRGITLR